MDLPSDAYTIASSDFVQTTIGVGFWIIGPSQLTIGGNAEKGNRFNRVGIPVTLVDFDSSKLDVSFNRMVDTGAIGVFAAQGFYFPQVKASDLLIRNNVIQANGVVPNLIGWNSAIQVWNQFSGFDAGPGWKAPGIFSNAIEVNFPASGRFFDQNGISMVNVGGATVQGNRVSGTGENAIYVGGYLPASRDAVAGNNLEQFRPHASRAHILLDTTSEYCTVNGSGNTTVTDKGTGNTVNGARRQ